MKLGIRKLTIAAALSLIALGSAHAQTKLKWAHVYETSEPYHTAALWAAARSPSAPTTATPSKCSLRRRSARKPISIRV